MSELDDRLSQLGAAEVPPPSSLDALRRRTARRRARRGAGAATAVVAVVAAGVLGMGIGDHRDEDVYVEPGPSTTTTTTAATTTTTTEVPPPETTTTTVDDQQPASPTAVPLAVASEDGVMVTDTEGSTRTVVSSEPAAVAYPFGSGLVVFQGGTVNDEGLTMQDGPVRTWSNGELREVGKPEGVSDVVLFDARVVDGAPTALIAEFRRDEPMKNEVTFTLIDLVARTRTVVSVADAWESGFGGVNVLDDGSIVALWSNTLGERLVRYGADGGDVLWSVPVSDNDGGSPFRHHVATFQGALRTVKVADSRSEIIVTGIDPATGATQAPRTVPLTGDVGPVGPRLECEEQLSADVVACSRPDGPPLSIDLSDGSTQVLPGDLGAVVRRQR